MSKPTRSPARCWRARRAAAGVVYSLAWGDQPALICEHVDWARACGFKVIAAGKGTRYHPSYHRSTPDTVWEILDKYLRIEDRNSINPKMFNSFIDGTKSGIEMTAVCNATGLVPQSDGLAFRRPAGSSLPMSASRRATAARWKRPASPRSPRRSIATSATCRIISPWAPMWCSKARANMRGNASANITCCPTRAGSYAALYRPVHMIGLELGISVASAALRGEPTGAPTGFRSDVVATAKRNLKKGEMLDGEGGFCVWGKQTPADHLARCRHAAARAWPSTSSSSATCRKASG